MKNYPILFDVRDPVIGSGFVAGVAISGRCLMREEEGGYWIDGVNPGALCAGGQSRDEALLKFMQHYRSALYNCAALCGSFSEFEKEVKRYFWEETPGEANAWQRAVEEVRANRGFVGDWLPLSERYGEPSIKVVCLQVVENKQASPPPAERKAVYRRPSPSPGVAARRQRPEIPRDEILRDPQEILRTIARHLDRRADAKPYRLPDARGAGRLPGEDVS